MVTNQISYLLGARVTSGQTTTRLHVLLIQSKTAHAELPHYEFKATQYTVTTTYHIAISCQAVLDRALTSWPELHKSHSTASYNCTS